MIRSIGGKGPEEHDLSYVKEGYFTIHNGAIYYVDNDLKIRKFTGYVKRDKFIADVIDLESWES